MADVEIHRRVKPLIVLALCCVSYACAKGPTERSGDHSFTVPDRHKVAERDHSSFLPQFGDDGFIFVLNPLAAQAQQILVEVDTQSNICGRAAGREAYVNQTVCSGKPLRWRGAKLRRSGGTDAWNYSLAGEEGAVVASCFEMSGPTKGSCVADLPFQDLVLSLHIRDAEIDRLDGHFDLAAGLLRTWER